MGFFSLFLNFLGGGALKTVTDGIVQARRDAANAKNDSERIAAEEKMANLNAQRDILLAEQGNWLTRWIRPAIAAPFVIYLWKLVLYDKVLGLGATDDLSPDLWKLFWIVIGAYFLTRPFEKRR